MHKKKNLKKLLNLGYLDYTNLTRKVGDYDMPYVVCNNVPHIDYLASYSKPATYFKTPHTAVSFFEYDKNFNGLYGLWNAICYSVKELQEFYIERFNGVKIFIAPDCSKCGDGLHGFNIAQQICSRIMAIWLAMHLHAIVVPLVSCANLADIQYMLDGMQECRAVAFNAMGPMGDAVQMQIFKKAIQYTVDHLSRLQSIVVYSAIPDSNKVRNIFSYAVEAGIEVQIPDNVLQTRNRLLGATNHGGHE